MEPTRPPLAARLATHLAAAPAVPLALAILAGTALGRHALFAPPGPLIVLALLGLALAVPRRSAAPGALGALLGVAGLSLAALAAGFLNGHLRGGGSTRGAFVPERERPVAAVVEVTGHWRRLDEVWSAPVRLVSLRQGERVVGPGRSATGIAPVYLHVSAGDGAPPGPFGATLRVKGVLDRPVRLGNPTPRPDAPSGPWRLKVKSRRLVTLERGPGPLARLAGALRGRVEEGIGRASGSSASGLGAPFARALLLGDGGDVPEPVKRAFRRLGLSHLLAVSGLHVGLVAGLALLLATPLGRSCRWLAALVAVGLYLLLVGPRPSLVRASVMACLGVAALLSHRPPSARNALALAAALLVALRPASVTEPGLQLSVGATAGLLWLAPRLSESWRLAPGVRRLPRWLREALAVSAGAQLGTLPWALPLFCLLVPAAPLVNLVAVPWAALLLVASALWAAAACVAPGLAAGLLPALDLLAAPAGWLSAVPPSPWMALPLALGAGAATLLAVVVAIALGRPRIGLPVLAAALAWTVWSPLGGADLPELVMIDVGQGDAILLRDGGETLLVDGGGWPAGDLGGRVLLPTLATLGVRSLDRVLATHFDRDHCGGLVQIAGYLPVAEVRTGPPSEERGSAPDPCEAELAALPGPRLRVVVAAGDRFTVGRWRLRVLHPARDGPGASTRGGARAGGDNDASVVLVAEAHGQRVLLTGDVEAVGERALLRRLGPPGPPGQALEALAADVLKVAHHGSRSSTTPRFLAATTPSLALVSSGARNPYGHPAPDVLARLRESGARVLRTDRHGMVVLRFHPDGRREIVLPGPL